MTAKPGAYARFAGASYFGIFALAIFANFFVLSKLIVDGDAEATWSAILADEALFRMGVAAFFVVLILDLFVAWALFIVLRPVNGALSGLAALFRISYTISHISVLLKLTTALRIIEEGGAAAPLSGFDPAFWTSFFLVSHQSDFTFTLVFFGVHLVLLGYLIIRSTFLPSLIGALVAIAGAGYIVDGFGEILFASYASAPDVALFVVILPALIGEGALMAWLLLRGLNQRKWLESARRAQP